MNTQDIFKLKKIYHENMFKTGVLQANECY